MMKKNMVLLYHEIVNDYTESGFQNKDNLAYMHKTEVFAKHLDLIKSLDFGADKSIVLSFDDGGISNLRAAKMLSDAQLKGVFFVTTSKIDKDKFLNQSQVVELFDDGHVIGSHSHTHPMIFRNLSYAKMREEWKVSKDILENILGHKVAACSIPGGDSDQKSYEAAIEEGYTSIYDSEPEVIPRVMGNASIYGRLSIKASTSDKELIDILTLKNLSALQRNRKIKASIKKLIFPIHNYIQNKKNDK